MDAPSANQLLRRPRVSSSLRLCQERGYHPTTFLQMQDRWGTKEAIERLVRGPYLQSGLRRLKQLNMLQWSVEQAVLDFPEEFPNRETRESAAWRLQQARIA